MLVPGDTLKIVDKALYVNNKKIPMWEHGKFLGPTIDKKYNQPDIFLSSDINVNRDHLGPIYVQKREMFLVFMKKQTGNIFCHYY